MGIKSAIAAIALIIVGSVALSAWMLMLLVGMIHDDILPVANTISFFQAIPIAVVLNAVLGGTSAIGKSFNNN